MSKYLTYANSLAKYLMSLANMDTMPKEYTNIKTHTAYGNVMVEDFGDFFPFLYSLQVSKKWSLDMAKKTIKKYQQGNGLFITGNKKFYNSDKMSDIILGINLMYELSYDPYFLQASKFFFHGLESHLMTRKGLIIYKRLGPVKYPFASGKFCGLYIEEAVKLYELSKDSRYLLLAQKMAEPWVLDKFFSRYNLFPFKCTTPFFKPFLNTIFRKETSFSFDTFMLTKSNTNLIFGLTRLLKHKENKKIFQSMLRWASALEEKTVLDNDVVNSLWSPYDSYQLSYLGADHAAIDALLEIYFLTNDKQILLLAERITNGWLKLQEKTGLVSETPFISDSKLSPRMVNYAMKNDCISQLDSQTDFSIVLLKMYEITKNQKYKKAGKKIIDGVLQYHKRNDYYVEFIHTQTGKNPEIYQIETKMLSLFLKALLVFDNAIHKNKIYDGLKDLVRDR